MAGETQETEGAEAVRIFGRSPETMAEVRDAINARAFRRQAFREYLQAARPPWNGLTLFYLKHCVF